eukprot:7630950-Alexandrium_andersonii.AAC.1
MPRIRALDPGARIAAYADDVYLATTVAHAQSAMSFLEAGLRGMGIELNPAKCKILAASPLQGAIDQLRVDRLP